MMLAIFEICYIEIICVDVDAHVAVRTKCNYIIHCLVSQTFWRSVADTYMHLSKKYNWNIDEREKKNLEDFFVDKSIYFKQEIHRDKTNSYEDL